MLPGVVHSCERCGYTHVSLSHTFWNCPNIAPSWTKIIEILSEIFILKLPADPVMSLLGVVPTGIHLNSSQIYVLFYNVISQTSNFA